MDLGPIMEDIEKDRQLVKNCESCGRKRSQYLYILKSLLYGIFHVCEDCREELECPEGCLEEVKAVFLKKPAHTWSEEVPQR
jgi:hypothetical protein